MPTVMAPLATTTRGLVMWYSPRRFDTAIGTIKTTIIASKPQPGPTESRSGSARYTPPAASIATNAGQPLQLFPPSDVENLRPSSAVTVAVEASLASTRTKSVSAGGLIVFQCAPLVVRRIVPFSPTNQQIFTFCADPAIIRARVSGASGFQVAPPSSDFSIVPAIIHNTFGSGV